MQATIPPWRSLKTRAALYTLAIFVLGLWALAFYVSRMLQADMVKLLGEQQFSAVSTAARDIDDHLSSRLQALKTVAAEMDASLMVDPQALQRRLEQLPLLQLLFNSGAFVVNRDGVAIANVPISAQRLNTSYIDRGFVVIALSGTANIGPPVIGKRLKVPVFAMAAPVRDAQGTVIGALIGATNLSMPNFLDTLTLSQYGEEDGYLLVSPQTRQIIAATDKKRVMEMLPAAGINAYVDRNMAGYEGHDVLNNALGVEQLASVKRIPVANWYLLLGLSNARAFAPIHDMQQRMFVAALLLTLLAAALTWWVLARQLTALATTAQAMVKLTHSTQTPQALPVTRNDEIGQLVSSFNILIARWNKREAALLDIEWKFSALFEYGPIAVAYHQMLYDEAGQPYDYLFIDANAAYKALTGVDPRGKTARAAFPGIENDPFDWIGTYGRVVRTDQQVRFEQHLQFNNCWYDCVAYRYQPDHFVVAFLNITARKQAEIALAQSKALFEGIFNSIPDAIVYASPQREVLAINPAFITIFGYDMNDLAGQQSGFFYESKEEFERQGKLRYNLSVQAKALPYEVNYRRKNGQVFPGETLGTLIKTDDGTILGFIGVIRDITDRKAQQHALEHMAHFDALTNLPNRVLLADRLQQSLLQVQRRGRSLVVVYIDLDSFKNINDQHSHEIGDQLLISVASRMKQSLREGDTLARLGGDEFVAVLTDLDDTAAALPLINRLQSAAAQTVEVDQLRLQVSASLGVTFYPQDQDIDADQLLRQADLAMYQAKLAGKNRFHIFDATQDSRLRVHNETLERIHLALERREFVLHYQPKVNMRTGKVVGAEALIRWQHPQRGLLAPADFLPVVEDDPLAVDVGEWVIEEALTQMEVWHAQGLDLPVSVNVGALQLQQAHFVERLHAILTVHPLVHPGCLALEILETSALRDITLVSEVIEACERIGVLFALDDFGTGYSSLTYLKRLRVKQLKIDQSFVRDMLDDPDDLAILQGVIGLAAAFRHEVIAEGVETVAHGTALLQLGCELAQGYGIARPMPAKEMPTWVAAWRPDAAWRQTSTA